MPRLIFLRRGAGDSTASSSLSITPPLLTEGFDFGDAFGLGLGSSSFLALL